MNEEDGAFDAALKAAEPAAKKRKAGASAAKKGKKRRGYHSSDDEDSDADDEEAEAMDGSDDDEAAAAAPKPSRRRASRGGRGGASAADDLPSAALATVRDLMLRERRVSDAFADLKLHLSLAALEHKCGQMASPHFFRQTPQYKALLDKLLEPLPSAAAAKRGPNAAAALGAAAAQDIVAGIVERKKAISAALSAKMQELLASGLSAATIARLLECSADEAGAVFEHMRIDLNKVAERFALHGAFTSLATPPGPDGHRPSLELNDIVALMAHHLQYKLRKGGA